MIAPVVERVDEILCMTVHPGYGGQSFMPEVLPKIRSLRGLATERGRGDIDILVDGGIDRETVIPCAEAGANVFVAGTALYAADDMAAEMALIRQRAREALRAA
jgi:ribulose-phosphate 3-epimerase